MRWAATTV